MKNIEKKDILDIIDKYWIDIQYEMAIEEFAELIQAIQKKKRYKMWDYWINLKKKEKIDDNYLEELADVIIMINTLKTLLDKKEIDIVEQYIDSKISRALKK